MPRILVTPPIFKGASTACRDVFDAAGFEVVYPESDPTKMTRPQLVAQLQGIDAVVAGIEVYDETIFAGTKLHAIARGGVGYDAIDVPAATRHGVPICITPGTNEHSVAEHAIALILACFRDIAARDREVRQGRWRRNPLRRLAGNTLGLVGLGRIGRAIVPRAQGLGLTVIAHDPLADARFAADNNITLCSFDELLERSDIVSLHIPCTADTTDLMNARSLSRMKPRSVLINTARGGLVDEEALLVALTKGPLFAAGLDVFKVEPPPADHPLLKLDNVVIAPHTGGLDRDAVDAMGQLAAECIVRLSRGDWPAGCVVNDELRAAYRW
ncbi:MAG TPA: phosphoglycerate dehydrogenase [Pirellulales bacterium]|nr:phosphoglycerate dehydrogenase [Pirellulales bacterium]